MNPHRAAYLRYVVVFGCGSYAGPYTLADARTVATSPTCLPGETKEIRRGDSRDPVSEWETVETYTTLFD